MTSSSKISAGLLYGPELHHLDHLAILCRLMQIPLVVTEEDMQAHAKKYYPGLEVLFFDYLTVAQRVVERFDVIFYTTARAIFDQIFFFAQKMQRKRIHTIWCPHGNSDKGHHSLFMEGLLQEEIALVYGQKMIDFLKLKGVFEKLRKHVIIGNYRYTYYKQEKEFYSRIIQKEILSHLESAEKTLLFAPTWQDVEHSSSFFDATPLLIEHLPEEYNLIIKLHPNLLRQEEMRTQKLLWKYENHTNVLFLNEFPPVYPLLDLVDVYIGDMSSIGYDFLTFDKPMFFLNQNNRSVQDPGSYLFRCGVDIKPHDYEKTYDIIDKHLSRDGETFSAIRKEVYNYVFGKEKEWGNLRHEILFAYDALSEHDIDLL